MSRAASPSTGKPYGLARVCRVWRLPRSTVYARRAQAALPPEARPAPPLLATSEKGHRHERFEGEPSPCQGPHQPNELRRLVHDNRRGQFRALGQRRNGGPARGEIVGRHAAGDVIMPCVALSIQPQSGSHAPRAAPQ